MTDRLEFATDGRDWPNREASRLVRAADVNWHVQIMGQGPVVLLLHGTGASSHSFARLAPLLARDFTIVVPDLPGHGFTDAPSYSNLSLPGMAKALSGLIAHLDVKPAMAVGHSAGAAILLRMQLDGALGAIPIVSINGAILPLRGLAGQIFAPIARMLVLAPFTPSLFAWRARDPGVVDELLSRTGSRIDPQTRARYHQLFRNAGHVGAALGMMANWDLDGLCADLPKLTGRLVLIAGAMDEMVRPDDAVRIAGLVRHAVVIRLRGLGHLAHEEAPELVADLVRQVSAGDAISLAPEIGKVMTPAPSQKAANDLGADRSTGVMQRSGT